MTRRWQGTTTWIAACACILGCVVPGQGIVIEATEQGLSGVVDTGAGTTSSYLFGDYHALLIGIRKYPTATNYADLTTPHNDVRALRKLLVDAYGFDDGNVTVLLEPQATRAGILGALDDYVRLLDYDATNGRDNLLIYFAGHGDLRWSNAGNLAEGFWIPHDATNDWHTWISGTEVTRMLQRVRAKVLLISDSCYAGAAFRSGMPPPPKKVLAVFEEMSRQAITSGGNEPVPDAGHDGHSIFAYRMLEFLRTNGSHYTMATELFAHLFQRSSRGNAHEPMPKIARLGDPTPGEFVLLLRHPSGLAGEQDEVLQPGVPPGWRLPGNVEPVAEPVGEDPNNEYTQRYYRINKGPDRGTQMVLVPGGSFVDETGTTHPIEPFLIDRYEVSFARFAEFVQQEEHDFGVDGTLKDPQLPIVTVTLQDAQAFAAWASKQLPEYRQWQFAARYAGAAGQPLRRYAWGDRLGDALPRQVRRDPPTVQAGARRDRSYWGVVGTTGGVREWCRIRHNRTKGFAAGGRQVRKRKNDRSETWTEAAFRSHGELEASTSARWLGFRCVLPLRR